MQGTIVMLMALTSLGCKHKSCDVTPVASCHSSCYSSCNSVSYTTVVASCYSDSCYSSSCYSDSCYSSCHTSKHGHKKMFGGLFHHKKRAHCAPAVVASCDVCSPAPAVYGCYSSVSYSAPVYAAAQSPMASTQSYSTPLTTTKMMPAAVPATKGTPQSFAPAMAPAAQVPAAPATEVPMPPPAGDAAPAGDPAPAGTVPATELKVPAVPAVPAVNPNI